jgi:hypothetical protein
MSEVNKEADSNELQVFISETLCAVMAAVNDVRETASIASAKGTGRYAFKAPSEVEFDIAVTAKKTGQGGGKLKLEVFSVGVSGGGEKGHETSTVSRIRFKIPRTFLQNGSNE